MSKQKGPIQKKVEADYAERYEAQTGLKPGSGLVPWCGDTVKGGSVNGK